MTTDKARFQLTPGFVVTIRDDEAGPVDLTGAQDCEVLIQRPDESVIHRKARPVGGSRLELGLHGDDLDIPGEYVGELRCKLGKKLCTYSPAFNLRFGQV